MDIKLVDKFGVTISDKCECNIENILIEETNLICGCNLHFNKNISFKIPITNFKISD